MDLIVRDCTSVMVGGSDQFIPTSGAQKIALRIMVSGHIHLILVTQALTRIFFQWAGYTSDWVRYIEVAPCGPITKAKLGQIVAQNFARFVEVNSSTPTKQPDWAAGRIRFEMLSLVALRNICDDTWQADVFVDFRP